MDATLLLNPKQPEIRTHARNGGWWNGLWRRRSERLVPLTAVAACGFDNRYYAGIQTIPVEWITGSLNRPGDYDASFRPLKSYDRERHQRIAEAWRRGEPMPPVELIRVGEHFFVVDGHHRIAAARAMGQQQVDAVVTVWEAADCDSPGPI